MAVLKPNERGVIFQYGRVKRVARSGLVLPLPLLEKLVVVNLDTTLPDWQTLSPDEVDVLAEFVVAQYYPNLPTGMSASAARKAIDDWIAKMKQRFPAAPISAGMDYREALRLVEAEALKNMPPAS